MEKESTGDMMALIEDINEQNIELEEIDLEKVEDQEKAADEKYNNFEAEQLRLGQSDLQEGWKTGTDLTEGWKTRSDLPDGLKLGEEIENKVARHDKTDDSENNTKKAGEKDQQKRHGELRSETNKISWKSQEQSRQSSRMEPGRREKGKNWKEGPREGWRCWK